jgi:lysophospholipase L1-like esterase
MQVGCRLFMCYTLKNAVVAIAGLLMCTLAAISLPGDSAYAQDYSWSAGEPTGSVRTDLNTESTICRMKEVTVGTGFGTQETICVYQADGFRYGFIDKYVRTSPWSGYKDESFVIGFPYESRMYRVEGLPIRNIVYVPQSKNLIYRENIPWSTWGYSLNIIKNLRSKLRPVVGTDLSVTYKLVDQASEPLLKNEFGNATMMRAVNVSDDGRWMIIELRPGGLLRMDMTTFDMKWFSLYGTTYGIGMDALMEFAISGDGEYVAVAGWNTPPQIFELNQNCGMDIRIFKESWRGGDGTTLTNPCPAISLANIIDQARGGGLRSAELPQFDASGGELTFYTIPDPRQNITMENKWITLRADGYQQRQIDYLAMGDSYSSGEGDTAVDGTTKEKYYLAYTDDDGSATTPKEKCHVSSRSYPFLLSAMMNIQSSMMQSIACSGALVKEDYAQDAANYSGQGKRLKDYPYISESLNKQALNEFIPGRLQQIEFVKEYAPKVITLTGGGNDVDFGGIIKACVSISKDKTCDYATNDKELSMVASDIGDQYDRLKELYKQLHDASPTTKIYVVGYPQFVSDRQDKCALNVLLDQQERAYVRQATSYLNAVIKAAANSEGLTYVDIEDSLGSGDGEHTLCGKSKAYVTGANLDCTEGKLVFLKNFTSNDCQEAYHPTAEGHKMIADMIGEKIGNLLTYNSCGNDRIVCPILSPNPDVPAYFTNAIQNSKDAKVAAAYHAKLAEETYVQKRNENAKLSLQSSSLHPNSTVQVLLHSEPILIGVFPVDNNGDLNVSVPVPDDIPAGYHTLHVIGQSYAGEPVDLWQIIEVRGVDGDMDENGTVDNTQQCMYTPASGVDNDSDGIDDACDVIIDDPARTVALTGDLHRVDTVAGDQDSRSMYNVMQTGELASNTENGQVAGVRTFMAGAVDSIMIRDGGVTKPSAYLTVSLIILISAGLFYKNRHNKKHIK